MLTIVVQAGGESSRMGTDKALLQFQGTPLIQRVINRVRSAGDQLLVVTNHPENYAWLEVPLFPDIRPNLGALGGLYTALASADTPFVANIACDMPFVNPYLLVYLLEKLQKSPALDVAIPQTDQGYEPMHAVFRRQTCLPAVENALDQGHRRMIAWFEAVQVMTVSGADLRRLAPDNHAFINLNTPQEFVNAEKLARMESG